MSSQHQETKLKHTQLCMSAIESDGTINVIDKNHDMNTSTEPSMGMAFAGYATIGFFAVMGLFLLCLSADAMGRSMTNIGKRLFLADGSGHSSMLTEIVIFVLVLGLVCLFMYNSFVNHKPPSADLESTA